METKTETSTSTHHHHSHAENYLWRAKDNIRMAVNSIHKPECEEDVKCAIARALQIAFDCGDFDLAAEVIYEATEFAIGHYELEEEE